MSLNNAYICPFKVLSLNLHKTVYSYLCNVKNNLSSTANNLKDPVADYTAVKFWLTLAVTTSMVTSFLSQNTRNLVVKGLNHLANSGSYYKLK